MHGHRRLHAWRISRREGQVDFHLVISLTTFHLEERSVIPHYTFQW